MGYLSNKRGMELSINFLVMLIISIVIFGMGVRFIYTISSEATELKDITSEELDSQVQDLLCSSSSRICIGEDKKRIDRGEFAVFGIKALNVIESQQFEIQVKRPTPGGYTKQNNPITTDSLQWSPKARSEFFERNEERSFGVGIQVPKNAVSGTYIFDVIVLKADGEPYTQTQKIYVEVP